MRPIDADKAIQDLETDPFWPIHAKTAIQAYIEGMPAIDPESLRPQGEWEEYPSDQYRRCSHCKAEWEKEKIPRNAKYCPNCGALMKGAGDA